jgi:DDE family transposase
MKSNEGFVQAYNGQIAVEPDFQLIVGQLVTQAANDKEQMRPMVEAIEDQSGQRPDELLTDAGYCSDSNLEYLESKAEPEKQIDAYVATGRQKHSEAPADCPRGPLPAGSTRVDRMRRKLQTKTGKAVYAQRKAIVEPVFGQIKQARGFRRFSLRGLVKVQGEWAISGEVLRVFRPAWAWQQPLVRRFSVLLVRASGDPLRNWLYAAFRARAGRVGSIAEPAGATRGKSGPRQPHFGVMRRARCGEKGRILNSRANYRGCE